MVSVSALCNACLGAREDNTGFWLRSYFTTSYVWPATVHAAQYLPITIHVVNDTRSVRRQGAWINLTHRCRDQDSSQDTETRSQEREIVERRISCCEINVAGLDLEYYIPCLKTG